MKNTVKIGQLVQFVNDCTQWARMNQNNQTHPLATCINNVMPGIQEALKPLHDEVDRYNKKLSEIKANHASKVTISENSQSPEHAVTAYEYTGQELNARNLTIQSEWRAFADARKAIEEQEVEIDVDYVRAVPTPAILPTNFITSMRGIVIDPAHDDNKVKILKPHAQA